MMIVIIRFKHLAVFHPNLSNISKVFRVITVHSWTQQSFKDANFAFIHFQQYVFYIYNGIFYAVMAFLKTISVAVISFVLFLCSSVLYVVLCVWKGNFQGINKGAAWSTKVPPALHSDPRRAARMVTQSSHGSGTIWPCDFHFEFSLLAQFLDEESPRDLRAFLII